MGLTPTMYFDNIVSRMVRAGFALISRVTIGDKDLKYHVPVTQARDTRLIFHVPGKCFIFVLSFNENDYYQSGDVRMQWRIDRYVQELPYETILKNEVARLKQAGQTGTPDFDQIHERLTKLTQCVPDGFARYGGWDTNEAGSRQYMDHWEQPESGSTPLDPGALVGACLLLCLAVAPTIASGPFQRLQVTSFPPYYTFPGCEQLFWKRFDTAYFRNVVRDPWGSGPR